MKFIRGALMCGICLVLGASSCSRSPNAPEPEKPVPTKPDPPDSPQVKTVLDTGWRQTGYRSPPMHKLYWLQKAGNTLVALDSANGMFAYQRDRGWWELAMPEGYKTRSSTSFIGIGDSVYFGYVGRKGATWHPASNTMTEWTIPGLPANPDSAWIESFGTYKGNLVASMRIRSWTKPCDVWIRIDGQWRPFGIVKNLTDAEFRVFYEASDGTLFGGSPSGLYYLAEDSVWTKIPPLVYCPTEGCTVTGITGITEYDGVGWVCTGGKNVAQFDVAKRQYIDTVQAYRVVADSVYKLYYFGSWFGMLHYGDYLFLPGEDGAPGVWVWNRKRKWFQHVPLLRKGVTYYTNNYSSTYGLAVMDDTLYATNSHGVVKFALTDIAADLARDTLPWPDTAGSQ